MLTPMWVEEGYDVSSVETTLLNYGVWFKEKFGFGVSHAAMFSKDFYAEFFIDDAEFSHLQERTKEYLSENFDKFMGSVENSKKEMTKVIKEVIDRDLSKISAKELFLLMKKYGETFGNLMRHYIMTQPHMVKSFVKGKKILCKPFKFSSVKSFKETIFKEDFVIDKSFFKKKLYVEGEGKDNKFGKLASERLKMREVAMKSIYFNELFLTELKRRYKVSKKNLRLYTIKEINSLREKKLPKEILTKRRKGFLGVIKEGKLSFTVGGSKVVERYKSEEIKGKVVSKGKVEGKVIVFSYKKSEDHSKLVKEMEKGAILVSEMTRPNIMVACKKAGAIVTDEGGMLSHAAIVSREMEIPCIVGTKNATSVLKNGDFVRVDAIKGIVRRIT